jgi:hypothetical protein
VSARRAFLSLTAALAPALLAGGCGKSASDEVRATLQRFGAATAKKDYQELCDHLLSRALVAKVEQIDLPCELALKTGLGSVRRPTLTVRRVSVSGDRALGYVHTTAANQRPSDDTIELVKEKGSWRIASLAKPQPQPPVPASKEP